MKLQLKTVWPLIVLILVIGCAGIVVRKDAQSPAASPSETEINPDKVGDARTLTGNENSEVILKVGDDIPARFREIATSKAVKRIVFEPGDYLISGKLELPRTGSLVVIDGQGANLKVKGNNPVFVSIPSDQKQAMVWNKTRYLIQNFGKIEGGSRGVFIGSSFNTVIRNIEFIGQSQAAIDLVFCLMSTVEEVLVTNVLNDGIVLRSAVEGGTKKQVWPGTSYNNSQCNHSVLRSCRVYNRKECTGTSFKILQSTGVRLVDCISEGWPNKHAVLFDAQDCTTAKYFAIENFHLEHVPTDGALCFRSNGSIVEVNGLYLQTGSADSPAIWLMNNGNYIFKNIPWWPEQAWVKSSNSPYVVIEQCKPAFSNFKKNWKNAERPGEPVYAPYLKVEKKLVR